ncbi:MAG: AhpC/TSA family protein [Flavobacteriaceae bacterium]|nr:AhpC/TSA family protein [Flavobacteriaceae bacterium]
MKKIITILSIFAFFISCKEKAKEQIPKKIEGYHIIGNLKKLNNKIVFLQKQNLDKTYNTIDKKTIKNNTFQFNDKIIVIDPYLMYLGFENSDHKIPVIINNFETFVNIDSENLDKTVIIGSTIQTEYTNYLKQLTKAKNKFVFQLNYIKSNSNTLLSVLILEQMLGKTKWRLGQNRKAYENLSQEIKTSELGKSIHNFLVENEPLVKEDVVIEELSLDPEIANIIPEISVFKETPTPKETVKKPTVTKPKIKKIAKRRKALNFSAKSQNGTDISLNQVRKNAKITLIDFWASWCGPCRKSNPHLIQLYHKYQSKGFTIIGVSEDKDKEKWKNAIAQDGLPWQQVIDDYGRIAEMYNVQSVPHTFLLDENGGIIFQKKSTYTIAQKLKEIFGF